MSHPPSHASRLGRWLALAGCAFAFAGLSACALIGRMGYDNFPTIAMWRVDTYLALATEQKQIASRRIEGLHAWHRRTQLDDYIGFLRDVQRHVAEGPVSEADVRRWRTELLERWRPIAEQAAPGVAEIARNLEPDQFDRMKAEFERDNAKLRKEWMPPGRTERIEARSKRYIERAELFMGSLSSQQKDMARRLAAEAPPTEEVWYGQRLGRQKDLVALMERIRAERPSDAVAAGWMREHLMRYAQLRDGPDKVGAESSLAASDAMTAQMLATATPKQQQHLQRKLQEWVELLQSLKPVQSASASVAVPGADAR